MRTCAIVGAAVVALWLAGPAAAQPASPAPDGVRLRLAHEVIEASGGVESMRTRMTAIFDSIHKLTAGVVSPDVASLSDGMFKYVADEELKAIPQLLDQTAEVYAESLTEDELRALLAWTSSPTGQSIQKKMPAISQDILLRQQPLMKSMMSGIFQRAADQACADTHCTPEQQKQLVAMMSQIAGVGGAPAPATSKN